MKEIVAYIDALWPVFSLPLGIMAVLAAVSSALKGFRKLNEVQERKKYAREWTVKRGRRAREAREREAAVLMQRAEDLRRQQAYPWNKNKIKLYGECASCGRQTAWPYVGRCVCGAEIKERGE